MIVLATPGMMNGGTSVEVFKHFCDDMKNCCIIPGYCVPGTLGNQLLSGKKIVKIDYETYKVNMEIQNMSFSAHVDSKGILSFIKHVSPKAVMLVHGEKHKMKVLKGIIESSIVSPCYCPANFESTRIKIQESKKHIEISKHITKRLNIN